MTLHPVTPSRRHPVTSLAWQGWKLPLPPRWNPVKLDGDYGDGYALIADMNRPQLGLRWRTIRGRRFDAHRWAERAMRDEVGRLAAAEAKALERDSATWAGSRLFLEPEPPGRDVWVAQSLVSRRVIEIIHHVRRRDRMLEDLILPGLSDSPRDQPQPWAVFDLSCTVPAGYELASHRLNAGDLSLTFALKQQILTIRQIALAELALGRLPMEKWLAAQERAVQKRYKPAGGIEPVTMDGMSGIRRICVRRRRFGFMRWTPRELVTCVLHDRERDRLLLLQASDAAALQEAARPVGG